MEVAESLRAAIADRYAIEREIGQGGMATVYLARDLKHDRQVALKLLRPELAASLGLDRFLREIRTTAQLTHPHILPLLDSGDAAGTLFYVMPYVEGESLRDRLTREKQLPLDDALQLTREVADALSYAHSRGVVHRDIKPENILLESGHAVVADFGIAKAIAAAGSARLTETGLAIGTPAYMSPEQAAGESDLDGRSDLYSLGCVLYEMLAGEPPFTGPSAQAVVAKRLSTPAPRVSILRDRVPDHVEQALDTALARTPADRFATCAQFTEALGNANAPAHRRTDAPGHRRTGAPWSPLAKWLVAAGILVAAGVAVVLVRGAPGGRGAGGAANSLAVIAFVNADRDSSLDWLGDGLAEEVATQLGSTAGLTVRSAGFVRDAWKVAEGDLRRLGHLVSVHYVVEGSYRRAGARVRVSARLLSLPAGDERWGRVYDRPRDSLSTLSDAIAIDLAAALGTSARRAERRPPDPRAYELYQRGRFFLLRLDVATAHSLFEQSIRIDSTYAQAWAGLAIARGDLWDVPALEKYSRMRQAASRALALDSTVASAYVSLAWVAGALDRDCRAGQRLADRALALDSTLPEGWGARGWMLACQSRRAEALDAVRRGWEADSLSAYTAAYLCDVTRHVAPERFAAAFASVRHRLRPDFEQRWAAWIAIRRGDCATAERILRPTVDSGTVGWYGRALVCLGRRAEAERLVRKEIADAEAGRHRVSAFEIGYDLALIGDRDGAIGWLERAANEPDWFLMWIHLEPDFAELRGDPRFVALERRLGLVP